MSITTRHRPRTRAAVSGALFLSALASTAQAGLFDQQAIPRPASPDATIVVTFPNRASLGFDPGTLVIEATYHANKPDEKGVRTVTHKRRQCPVEIPVPFGCSTHTYTETVDQHLRIRKEWISVTAPHAFAIRVSEHLSGPGDYQLSELSFACLDALCHGRKPIKEWKMRFGPGARADQAPAFMRLGVDEASTFTASYQGKVLSIEATAGSYAARVLNTYVDERVPVRAVQDESGRWHISSSAYTEFYEPTCAEPYLSSASGRLNAKGLAGTAWAVPFKEFALGDVYNTTRYEPSGSQVAVKPSEWTGCVALKAQGIGGQNDDFETRYYTFENGQLRSRRISRYAFRASFEEYVELDAGPRLLFYRQHQYVDKTRSETDERWSRLQFEAYPRETPAAPKLDIKALLSEAEDVRAIITPHFVPR